MFIVNRMEKHIIQIKQGPVVKILFLTVLLNEGTEGHNPVPETGCHYLGFLVNSLNQGVIGLHIPFECDISFCTARKKSGGGVR
jgi:hypothetical protein